MHESLMISLVFCFHRIKLTKHKLQLQPEKKKKKIQYLDDSKSRDSDTGLRVFPSSSSNSRQNYLKKKTQKTAEQEAVCINCRFSCPFS